MKNFRDLFFGMMNQSMAQKRICDAEDNIKRLWEKCGSLTETTTQLDNKIDQTKRDLNATIEKFKQDYQQMVLNHEERF